MMLWLLLLLLELLHHIGHDAVDSPSDGDVHPGHWPLTCSLHLWRLKHGEIVVLEVTVVFLDVGDVSSVVTKERLNVNTGDQFYKCSGPLNGLLASDWPVVTLPPADWPSSKAFQVSVTHCF